MAQTPAQRRANAKYASTNEKRMGKPESAYKKKELGKSPVGRIVVVVLIFVIVIPLLLEPMKLLPAVWDTIRSMLASIGLVSR